MFKILSREELHKKIFNSINENEKSIRKKLKYGEEVSLKINDTTYVIDTYNYSISSYKNNERIVYFGLIYGGYESNISLSVYYIHYYLVQNIEIPFGLIDKLFDYEDNIKKLAHNSIINDFKQYNQSRI